MAAGLDYLERLENETMSIILEVAAGFERPVFLYSIGKDSTALLHMIRKAFLPQPVPFPILHIDTGWKFRDMIAFRDNVARELELDLKVYTNHEAAQAGVTPFSRSSVEYNDLMKTQALRQALADGRYDAAIGGARRDEEKSRAKERIFSLRTSGQSWDPRRQRPEFWRLYNSLLGPDETMRVFPLSDWTERDVWAYIARERLDVVPLYFAKERPVVRRNGAWIMVDDERFVFQPGENVEMRSVRFRSLGCYPYSGAVESTASSLDEIVAELDASHMSEREGRLIDSDQTASMERKKREGYF